MRRDKDLVDRFLDDVSYLVIVVAGFFRWRQQYQLQETTVHA